MTVHHVGKAGYLSSDMRPNKTHCLGGAGYWSRERTGFRASVIAPTKESIAASRKRMGRLVRILECPQNDHELAIADIFVSEQTAIVRKLLIEKFTGKSAYHDDEIDE